MNPWYDTEKMVLPKECPECHNNHLIVEDWGEGYIVYLYITCQDCNYRWNEKIDLTI